jgi:hypothetical protein
MAFVPGSVCPEHPAVNGDLALIVTGAVVLAVAAEPANAASAVAATTTTGTCRVRRERNVWDDVRAIVASLRSTGIYT